MSRLLPITDAEWLRARCHARATEHRWMIIAVVVWTVTVGCGVLVTAQTAQQHAQTVLSKLFRVGA
jgi:hypothetical protein